jgi:CubicO group peptidase (beta-lactamase class C family)
MKQIMKILFVVFATISASLFALKTGAQDAVTAKVDAFIKNEMQKQKIPGVSLGVIKNGRLIYANGYGFANVEHKVAVKPETIFQSGSVGKQFTSMAIMILVEEGKVEVALILIEVLSISNYQ